MHTLFAMRAKKHTPVFVFFFFILLVCMRAANIALFGGSFVCVFTHSVMSLITNSYTHTHICRISGKSRNWHRIDNKNIFEFEHMRAFDSLMHGRHCTPISTQAHTAKWKHTIGMGDRRRAWNDRGIWYWTGLHRRLLCLLCYHWRFNHW